MSDASETRPAGGGRPVRVPRDYEQDLEALVQRLAESREAIVQLLAAAAHEAELVHQRAPSPGVVSRLRPLHPVGPGDAVPPVVAAAGGASAEQAADEGDEADYKVAIVDAGVTGGRRSKRQRRLAPAQRHLVSLVLVAVGAVLLLTTLVSL